MDFNKTLNKYCAFSLWFLLLFIFIDNYKNSSDDHSIYDSDFTYNQDNDLDFDTVDDSKININVANQDVLSKYLWGIGNSKARNIINYREKMGGFYSINEILNVSGIGENIFNKIKDFICIYTISN
ncbi:MAG: helix-hairpin-helix domain-containing protein [Oscillospiraceae bacterium]|jgi:competence ComEA-like helix-hairpin-helix protein|nr:helix-hairpin-helix domain-containing protein [Oscillospiraceae bacterium]